MNCPLTPSHMHILLYHWICALRWVELTQIKVSCQFTRIHANTTENMVPAASNPHTCHWNSPLRWPRILPNSTMSHPNISESVLPNITEIAVSKDHNHPKPHNIETILSNDKNSHKYHRNCPLILRKSPKISLKPSSQTAPIPVISL